MVACPYKTNCQNGADPVAKYVVVGKAQVLARARASPFLTLSKFIIELFCQCGIASTHQLVGGRSLHTSILYRRRICNKSLPVQ